MHPIFLEFKGTHTVNLLSLDDTMRTYTLIETVLYPIVLNKDSS